MSLLLFPVSGWEYICEGSAFFIYRRQSLLHRHSQAEPGNENNENMYEITLPKKVQSQQPGCCLFTVRKNLFALQATLKNQVLLKEFWILEIQKVKAVEEGISENTSLS